MTPQLLSRGYILSALAVMPSATWGPQIGVRREIILEKLEDEGTVPDERDIEVMEGTQLGCAYPNTGLHGAFSLGATRAREEIARVKGAAGGGVLSGPEAAAARVSIMHAFRDGLEAGAERMVLTFSIMHSAVEGHPSVDAAAARHKNFFPDEFEVMRDTVVRTIEEAQRTLNIE